MVVIKLVAICDPLNAIPRQFYDHIGSYLQDYEPVRSNLPYGLISTENKELAKKFANAGAALSYWRSIYGYRTDNRPNRPLTIYSVEIENADNT